MYDKGVIMLDTIPLEIINDIARQAGMEALKIYNQDFYATYKDDMSPVTEADMVANTIICKNLSVLFPHIPIISEENKSVPYAVRREWEYYFCIDPIDGTKDFIKKNDEWTINIGMIYKNSPVLGVVYAPALDLLYSAKKGGGAYKNYQIIPLQRNDNVYKIVASRSHLNEETQNFIDNLKIPKQKEIIFIGSSLKLCLVASGEVDCYPRLAPTKEWDIAAADAIVRECGKMTYDYYTQQPLCYNKEDMTNPYFIVE